MARRRSWGMGRRIGFGLAQGGQQIAEMLMRDQMADRQGQRIADRQEDAAARTMARQAYLQRGAQEYESRQQAFKDLPDMVDKLGPEGAAAYLEASGTDLFPPEHGPDFVGTGERERELEQGKARTTSLIGQVQQPMRRKLESSVGKSISGATAPEQLDPSDIESQIRAADPRAVPQLGEPGMTIGGLKPEAYEYVDRANVKRDALLNKPTNTVSGTDASGRGFTRKYSDTELAQGVETAPDAQTQGTLAGQESVAKEAVELSPTAVALRGQAQGRIAAMVENMTRAARVQTAGDIAGATKRAQLAPDIVDAEVDRDLRMDNSQGKSTQGERTAATNFPVLINAHAKAVEQELNGAFIGVGDVYATGDNIGAPLLNWAVPDSTKQYLQSARDFISTFGLIRSGVAVPPSERDSFIASMFATKHDDDKTVQQKQQTREVFISAMQTMVGRSTEEAASILASTINQGQIPLSVFQSLTLEPALAEMVAAKLRVQ